MSYLLEPQNEPETRLLDIQQYAATGAVSRELLHRTDAQVWLDQTRDVVTLRLVKDLLVDKVLEDEARVPVTGTVDVAELPNSVLVELPRTWWQRLLRRQPVRTWCPVVASAGVHDAPDRISVRGHATVRADYFRTFPEAQPHYYPRGLGPVRVLVNRHPPGLADFHTAEVGR